jgi:hypothetical protein
MIETKMVEYGYLIEKTLCVTTAATSFVAFPVAGPSFFSFPLYTCAGQYVPNIEQVCAAAKIKQVRTSHFV